MNTQRLLQALLVFSFIIAAAPLYAPNPEAEQTPTKPEPAKPEPVKPDADKPQKPYVIPSRIPTDFLKVRVKDRKETKADAEDKPDRADIIDKYGWVDKKLADQLNNQGGYNPHLLMHAFPKKALLIAQQLKETPLDKPLPAWLDNKMILYGPPGVGKSALVQLLAKEAGCEFVKILAPALVNEYQGSGAQNIRREVEAAIALAKSSNKRVVICIEEIDAIAKTSADNNKNNRDSESAIQTLWLLLDEYRGNQYVHFASTTNHFEKLNRIFRDRHREGYLLEFFNPDKKLRQDIIREYLKVDEIDLAKALRISKIEADRFILKMASSSNEMSIRALEGMVHTMKSHIVNAQNPQQVSQASLMAILQASRAQSLKRDPREVYEKPLEFWDRINRIGGVHGYWGAATIAATVLGTGVKYGKRLANYIGHLGLSNFSWLNFR